MSYAEYNTAITAAPDDDELRLQFAEFWRLYGEPLTRFIELQIERARRRRLKNDYAWENPEEEKLLARHGAEWAHTIKQYSRAHVFYRGFVAEMTVDPYLFLEQGAYLFKLAPLRHLAFHRPAPEDGPFPLAEILASPLLARLDSLGLASLGLTDEDVATIATCPHLERCVFLDLTNNDLWLPAFEALAASPSTRRLLCVARDDRCTYPYSPGESLHWVSGPEGLWGPIGLGTTELVPMTPEGAELERKYGYIPWLHMAGIGVDRFDARWLLEQGLLPPRPPGSPV